MKNLHVWFLYGVCFYLLPISSAWGQDEASSDPAMPSWPVTQTFAALVFGGLALGSILRSSRRGWN